MFWLSSTTGKNYFRLSRPSGLPKVTKWKTAADGGFNLVLKLEANDTSLRNCMCVILALCELLSDNSNPKSTLSPDYSYSYLFIETERYQQKAVQSSLEKSEAIIFCSPTFR